jgi:hypothetical protein
MQLRRSLFAMTAVLLVIAVLLGGCGVNPPAQAGPGAITDILPTPPPMPTSRPLPPTPTPPNAPAAGANTAGAQTLLNADFSSAADLSNWTVVDGFDALSSPSSWKIGGGRLEQAGNGDGAPGQYPTALITGKPDWQDYQVSVSAYNTGNDEIGLAFRAGKQGYYVFRILPDVSGTPHYNLSRFDAATDNLTNIAQAQGPGFQTGRWYQISVKVKGAQIQTFVDGKAALEARDTTLTSGGVGVYGYAQGQLLFDNLVVQTLSGN